MKRDPRINPLPGDEIGRNIKTSLGGFIFRKVTRSHGGFVFFAQDNGYRTKHRRVNLKAWQQWAIKAEIIETAKA